MTRVKNERLKAEVGIILAGKDSIVVSKRGDQSVTLPMEIYLTAFREAGWTLKGTQK